MDTIQDVFKNQRWEANRTRHVYWLDEPMLHELAGPLSAILTGSRGTGKTTLLNSISHRQRLTNRWLSKHRGGDFEDGLLGLYIKLPLQHFDRIDVWTSNTPLEMACDWTAFYFDLTWLEVFGDAVDLLHRTGRIQDLAVLDAAAAELLEELQRSPAGRDALTDCPGTAIAVLKRVHDLRRQLELHAVLGTDPAQAYVAFDVPRVGELGRTWAARFGDALEVAAPLQSGNRWTFKVLLDEAENLSERQQIAANSLMRLAQEPISYVFSYVSLPDDIVSTCIPGLSLSNADRKLLARDGMTDAEFDTMCHEIVNARIRSLELDDGHDVPKFDLDKVVGNLALEDVLESHFSGTVGTNALQHLQAAKFDPEKVLRQHIETVRPLASTFTLEQVPDELDEHSRRVVSRRDDSSGYRKIKVAAYLSLCKELKWRPRYAGRRMILQISDQCIRDFLLQMDALVKGVPGDGRNFLNGGPMSVRKQDQVLRRVSLDKVRLASGKVRTRPHETSMLIQGLALTTYHLQSFSRNGLQLAQPERGIFRIDFGDGLGRDECVRMVREAAEAGYLKIRGTPQDEEVYFRVHNSLAPNYSLSYRGAYYQVTVPVSVIHAFRSAGNAQELGRLASRFVRSIRARDDVEQGFLFDRSGDGE